MSRPHTLIIRSLGHLVPTCTPMTKVRKLLIHSQHMISPPQPPGSNIGITPPTDPIILVKQIKSIISLSHTRDKEQYKIAGE
eukprot:10043773-Ditylum_brightwellii.AAC.1